MNHPMSPDEFRESARVFRYMHLDAMFDEQKFMDVEYKGYRAFLETAEPKHVREFFEKGSIRFGKWNLYADLSIGPADSKVKHTRLSCTDGGAFDLPYFDKLIQKYVYLKNSPDTIIQIGLRHMVGGHGNPLYRGDTLNRVTVEWGEIMKRRSLQVHGHDVYKVTGLDGWRLEVMKWFHPHLVFARYPGYVRVSRHVRRRGPSITVGDETLYVDSDVTFNDVELMPSRRRRRRGRPSEDIVGFGPMSDFFSSAGFADARRYPKFYTQRVKDLLAKGDVKITRRDAQLIERMLTKDIDDVIEALKKDMRPFKDDIFTRIFVCMTRNSKLKQYMRMQTQIVFAILLVVLEKVGAYDVIDYYALHPEHAGSICGGKKP